MQFQPQKKLQQLGVALGNPILYKLTYKDLGLCFFNSFHPQGFVLPYTKTSISSTSMGGSSTKV
jgi:hypothetical protein